MDKIRPRFAKDFCCSQSTHLTCYTRNVTMRCIVVHRLRADPSSHENGKTRRNALSRWPVWHLISSHSRSPHGLWFCLVLQCVFGMFSSRKGFVVIFKQHFFPSKNVRFLRNIENLNLRLTRFHYNVRLLLLLFSSFKSKKYIFSIFSSTHIRYLTRNISS